MIECKVCDDKSKLTEQQMNFLALIAMSTEEELKALIDIAKENNKREGERSRQYFTKL